MISSFPQAEVLKRPPGSFSYERRWVKGMGMVSPTRLHEDQATWRARKDPSSVDVVCDIMS
eukprot:559607-Amphidinium_carterae.1